MDEEVANARRCQGRAGTYEAWYVTFNDPSTRRGFWIRYTTLQPAPGMDAAAESALWAFAFYRDDPASNWGAKQSFPIEALQSGSRPFHLRLTGAEMKPDGCAGELRTERGVARWDLRWESREPPFPFIDPRFQSLSSVANIAARPAIAVTGTIEIGGRTHRLDRAPGGQQHTWGASHALAWNWGFGSGTDYWVDGATSRVRSRLGRILTGTAVGAGAGGESFLYNGFLKVLSNRGPISPAGWTAAARLGDQRLKVSVTPRPEDLLGVTYADPAGGKRYCYHTEVADLELMLSRRDQLVADIKRPAAAAFEYASEVPLPGIRLFV
jgi:hypothetical protein